MHGVCSGTALAAGHAEGIPGQFHTDCTGRIPRAFYRAEAGEKVPIEEVIDLASNLIENGVKDNIKLHQS